MRRTKDGQPLAPYHLRDHAEADPGPFWVGQARQLLRWAADCMESAERIIEMHRPRAEKETPAVTPEMAKAVFRECDCDQITRLHCRYTTGGKPCDCLCHALNRGESR